MKKILCVILALISCLSFASCQKEEQNPSDTTLDETESVTYGEIISWKAPTPVRGEDGLYHVIVNDYERPADFSPMQARRDMTVLVEKETVHSGEQSAKLICKKEYKSYSAVSVAQPFNLEHRGNFTNIKSMKKISFWAYNAQLKEMDLTFLIKFEDDKEYKVTTKIPSCEWFLVEIPIEHTKLPSSKNLQYVSFSFQPIIGSDTVFYIDDLCLYRTTK